MYCYKIVKAHFLADGVFYKGYFLQVSRVWLVEDYKRYCSDVFQFLTIAFGEKPSTLTCFEDFLPGEPPTECDMYTINDLAVKVCAGLQKNKAYIGQGPYHVEVHRAFGPFDFDQLKILTQAKFFEEEVKHTLKRPRMHANLSSFKYYSTETPFKLPKTPEPVAPLPENSIKPPAEFG